MFKKMFNFKKKEKINSTTEKILKFLIIVSIIVLGLYGTTEYGLYQLKKNELSGNIKTLNENIKELERSKNELSKLSHSDIIKIKGVFENKTFNEKILMFKTGQVEFLEKVLRKDTNKFYATIKVPFEADKEIDLRKYLLLQSLNKKIYKLTDLKKEKDFIIEIIYEL